jgi:DNA-directed RNA polymerase specialized sigma24 family protein
MRDVLNKLVLTVAGLGLLSGSAAASGTVEAPSPAAVRAALQKDPEFGSRLETFRRRALAAVRSHPEAQDAVQETLLKVWRGRPDLFLKGADEVVRYLRTATRRNLATNVRKSAGPGTQSMNGTADLLDGTAAEAEDPLESVASEELLPPLTARLAAADLPILEAYLDGATSQREIGRRLGLTRYAVGAATARIGDELRALLGEVD